MKHFKPLFLLALVAGYANVSQAQEFGGEDLNGFLGFGGGIASHSNNYVAGKSAGSRREYNLEFARLASNVSLQFTYGNGGGYSTLGGRFKLFRPIPITENGSSFLIIPGLDFAADYSSGGVERVAGSGDKIKFTDIYIGPDIRFLYDFKMGLGVALDTRYDIALERQWKSSPHKQSSPHDHVLYFGLTFVMDSRFIE